MSSVCLCVCVRLIVYTTVFSSYVCTIILHGVRSSIVCAYVCAYIDLEKKTKEYRFVRVVCALFVFNAIQERERVRIKIKSNTRIKTTVKYSISHPYVHLTCYNTVLSFVLVVLCLFMPILLSFEYFCFALCNVFA